MCITPKTSRDWSIWSCCKSWESNSLPLNPEVLRPVNLRLYLSCGVEVHLTVDIDYLNFPLVFAVYMYILLVLSVTKGCFVPLIFILPHFLLLAWPIHTSLHFRIVVVRTWENRLSFRLQFIRLRRIISYVLFMSPRTPKVNILRCPDESLEVWWFSMFFWQLLRTALDALRCYDVYY